MITRIKSNDKPIAPHVTLWEKLSYGGGDAANCITFGVISSYLSYYYTDIAGIPLVAVGVILGVTRLIEALVNFFTGVAIDKSNSKFGKTKPFLYFTTAPLMIVFALVFFVPDISEQGKTIFAFITYLLFCIFYAISNTAYGTMMAVLEPDAKMRRSLSNFKVFGSGLGGLVASFCTLPLIALFGVKGRLSFAPMAVLYAVVSLFLLGNCAFSCKERTKTMGETSLGMKESLQCAVKSRSWVILCIISGLSFFMVITRYQSFMYYARYVMGNEAMATVLLTVCTAAQLASAPILDRILNKIGNQKCMMLGYGIFLLSSVGMILSERNVVVFIFFVFLSSYGNNLANSPSFSICADTIDEVEYLTGKRPQGIMTSFMMCTMKAGIALAGIVAIFVLNLGHYVADAPTQSTSAIVAIKTNVFYLPMVLIGCCFILAFFFKQPKNK